MKIALYRNTLLGFDTVCKTSGLENSPEYIQISEPVEIEFKMLDSEIVEKAYIDKAELLAIGNNN